MTERRVPIRMKKRPKGIDKRFAKLDYLACRAQYIDEEQYPEMSGFINRFLVLDSNDQDYKVLAGDLMNADQGKVMPEEVVDFIRATYEYYMDKGDALATNDLGVLYYGGRVGGKPDYVNARKYYEVADRLGYTLASENLAYIFYYGFGTEVNYEKAYLYFSKAALWGRYEASYKIGDMFRNGYYVEKNDKMTAFFYRRALDLVWKDDMGLQKNVGCVYQRVGDLFYEGIGVEQNDAEAFRYYQLAEGYYYKQIEEGDRYHFDQVKVVIEKQKKLRKRLQKRLPDFEL